MTQVCCSRSFKEFSVAPLTSVLSAFQLPGTEDSQEDLKGNLESPKQGSNKMKLKSRLSGKSCCCWLVGRTVTKGSSSQS